MIELPGGKLRIARILIGNAFVFFLASALLITALYIAGNYHFLRDATAFFLLRLLYWNGIILFVFAILSMLLTTVVFVLHHEFKLLSFLVIYAAFAVSGLILTLFSGSVLVLAGGNEL
ncbi:MAG: hypothetical protein LBD22_06835 [Spirochaetaceae bacterium]|jgi:hypothetical protein|nr:hypothetical protein [Spirochaetaceae bacterium]